MNSPPPILWPPPLPCLRPVVEGDSSGRLLLAEKGWRLHLGVAEAQVFMEVVKAINKVSYMTAQHLIAKTVERDREKIMAV